MLFPFLIIFSLPLGMQPAPIANAPSTHFVETVYAQSTHRDDSANGESTRRIVAEITAYSSSVDETDETPNLNARGTTPAAGSIACPRYYEFGTEFIVEGKRYSCDDRMSTRFPDRFDIWLPSKEEALEFGIKTLEIEVVE